MIDRCIPEASMRVVACLLAVTTVAPCIQWCNYRWKDLRAECLVECAISTRLAGCPARSAPCGRAPAADRDACAPAGSDATACEGLPPSRACASSDPASAPSERAWCPQDLPGGPTVSAGAAKHVPPLVALAVPGPDVMVEHAWRSRRVVETVFARPPTREANRRPPARAPPCA